MLRKAKKTFEYQRGKTMILKETKMRRASKEQGKDKDRTARRERYYLGSMQNRLTN